MPNTMEANDLESFFLNKDKKKKSKKTYVINPSLLIEQAREAELKKAKKLNEKSQQSQEAKIEILRKTKVKILKMNLYCYHIFQEDDEWEEETELDVDISNLRIGMMPQKVDEAKPKIGNNNVENASQESDSDTNSKKNDKSAHPWGNKVTVKTYIETVTISEPSQVQKYRPPAMRGGDLVKMSMKPSKKAPNIANSSEFPSLNEMADIDTEDGTWFRVNKNGHCQPQKTSEQVTKKCTQPVKREIVPSVEVAPVIEKKPVVAKYIPPSMRRKNENRQGCLEGDAAR